MNFPAEVSPAIAPFARELAQVAEILKGQRMPQELINMTLAARAGLPVAPVDSKSPIFEWVEEENPNLSEKIEERALRFPRPKVFFLEKATGVRRHLLIKLALHRHRQGLSCKEDQQPQGFSRLPRLTCMNDAQE